MKCYKKTDQQFVVTKENQKISGSRFYDLAIAIGRRVSERVEKVWIEQDCFYGTNKCGSWTLGEHKTCVSFVWNGSQCLQQKLNQNSDLSSLDSDCKETEKRWKKCSNECG